MGSGNFVFAVYSRESSFQRTCARWSPLSVPGKGRATAESGAGHTASSQRSSGPVLPPVMKGLRGLASGGQQRGLRCCAGCRIQRCENMDPAPQGAHSLLGWHSVTKVSMGEAMGAGAAKGVALRHWRPRLLKGQPGVWRGRTMVVCFIEPGLSQTYTSQPLLKKSCEHRTLEKEKSFFSFLHEEIFFVPVTNIYLLSALSRTRARATKDSSVTLTGIGGWNQWLNRSCGQWMLDLHRTLWEHRGEIPNPGWGQGCDCC